MSSSLFKLVDNLSEGIHNNKCSDCKSNLDYVRITKNKNLLLKCFNCNIYYKKKINNDLIKKFKNTYSFCNNDTTESMSKKLPVNGFKWLDNNKTAELTAKHVINEAFIKNYNENDKKGYILKVDVRYPKKLHDLHSDLPFLPERMEINKCKKLVCNLYDEKKYVVHINSLKQALNHGLKLKKIHRIIEFNQKAWLKLYIDMNTELRKLARNDFEKTILN